MFRLKIVLLSIFLSGSVLIGSGWYFLSVMNKVGMDRIDQEIMALGGGQLHVAPPPKHWQNFGKSLHFIYGEDLTNKIIVRITNAWNDVPFKSSHWPKEISETSFPDFDRTMDTRPGIDRGQRPEDVRQKSVLNRFPDRMAGFDRSRNGLRDEAAGRPRLPPHLDDNDGVRDPPALRPYLNDPDVQLQNGFRPAATGLFQPESLRIKKSFLKTIKTSTGTWRVGIMGNQRYTMLLGMNLEGFYRDAGRFRTAFLITAPLALLLLAGGGWLIAHRAMKPVALITRTAEGITAHALDRRIPSTNADRELARLVEVINRMLDRLQKSFSQTMRFSADASHELQTPLTILQGELDDAIQHAPLGSEEQRRYGAFLEEVQRLKVVVQKLLVLARADAGKLSLRLEPVDLSALIESAVEDAGAIAPQLRLEKRIAANVLVMGDPALLRQVVQNLLSNAVKYNLEQGLIRSRLTVHGDTARFTISNTGALIPFDDAERIFERFFRVDKSRSGATPGAGLGLSLARELARAHQGDLHLDPALDGLISFTLSLPCCPERSPS